jgi:Spy/CpxP family protein refolding chaperone
MTHIRSALVAGMLVFGGALVASAQQPVQAPVPQAQHQGQHAKGQRGMGARKHRDQAFKGLALSAAEKANIKAVHQKYAPQMKTLRSQGKTDASRQQAMQLMQSQRADLRGALSSENQAKFDANAAKMKQRMEKRGQRKPAAKPVQ